MAAVLSPPGDASRATEVIRVRGVRVHNLRDLDADIPRDRIVAITGPSGSGKSSLAFDTLYAESRRQYLETLSVSARRLLPMMERPDADWIDGLPPAICVDQRADVPNPRSTVATLTEVYDLLRLLYARLGTMRCPRCGEPVEKQTSDQVLAELRQQPEGTKAVLLAPLIQGEKGAHRGVLARIRKLGFLRARIDGEIVDLDEVTALDAAKAHTIEAVIDRVVLRPGIEDRLAESLRQAFKQGNGLLRAALEQTEADGRRRWVDRVFSRRRYCGRCAAGYPDPEPRTFSFHSAHGACWTCQGFGYTDRFAAELVLDFARGLGNGAVRVWADAKAELKHHRAKLQKLMRQGGFDWSTPLADIPDAIRAVLIHGENGGRGTPADGKRKPARRRASAGFVGILPLLELHYEMLDDARTRKAWSRYRSRVTCPECKGARLGPLGRSVFLGEKTIHDVTCMTPDRAARFLAGLQWTPVQKAVAEPILDELSARLGFLAEVGLTYVALNRAADTLSGGELQRAKLAAGMGAVLTGVCYILDEPSVGLHPRDNDRLIAALRCLRDRGNTVLVVEHDEALIRSADWILDIGPGAGEDGGRLTAQGTLPDILRIEGSPTGRYLSGKITIPTPQTRRPVRPSRAVVLEGVTTNNLQDVTAVFPLGVLVCVTGVSGSGKSSLLSETLAPALRQALQRPAVQHGGYRGLGVEHSGYRKLSGADLVDRVVEIDQTPIGRSARSNAATYCGIFDEIRKVFAATREARRFGFTAARFSFNVPGGRCEACEGQGRKKVEMDFLPDIFVPCPVCEGTRFNRTTLEVRYRGKNIAQVLEMSAGEALDFFTNFPVIARLLAGLCDVGLGYLKLGQPSTTLSGGEAQRIKLAAELGRSEAGNTLYLLDEPTTGLHFQDIQRVLDVLNRLVDRGNSVIVVEHQLDVIKSADWIIDLGPEGGTEGGRIVAEGTPEQVAQVPNNHTARYLARVLPAA
ncbi:MAG: excinuclease ABC subunit UvrA [Thermogutta sp.]|nr:excinuclease ABC subunit UvrA [Thermogutta sp.]